MHKKLEDNTYEKINHILISVKLSVLLFCVIICSKYLISQISTTGFRKYELVFSIILIILFILGIYFISTTAYVRQMTNKKQKYKLFIESCIFISIFFMTILISGVYESPYKFLFLFIIITTTIQAGMKSGVIMASISAVLIVLIHLMDLPECVESIYFEGDLILMGMFILTVYPLGYYVESGNRHIEQLKDMTNRDGLTGVYNHRFFQEALIKKVQLAMKENKPISMLFIDIDHFKFYNDLNGHQKGDAVLKEVAQIIDKAVREEDIVARYGGEEFAIILPNTGQDESIKIAERIRKKVEETYIIGQENQPTGNLTISIGIATYPKDAKDEIELIKNADEALYRAKFFNKNRVEVYVSILDELKRELDDDKNELITSIKTFISVINAKDQYTYGHCERVMMYSKIMADYLNLNEKDKKILIYGAYMHDIGKINIPEKTLNKKIPLDEEEWEMVKKHAQQGAEIIKTVGLLNEIIPPIFHHHERYDGTGYPHGLKGTDIPLLARILTVVDCFDAMTSNRPYHAKPKTDEEGFAELRACKGTQFDPEIVEAFITALTRAKQGLEI